MTEQRDGVRYVPSGQMTLNGPSEVKITLVPTLVCTRGSIPVCDLVFLLCVE